MNDVTIEPPLHPLSGEHFLYWLINIEDGASLDVIASGSCAGERAFVYIQLFNALAHSQCRLSFTACYRKHEQEKKRSYDQRIHEVEHECFHQWFFPQE